MTEMDSNREVSLKKNSEGQAILVRRGDLLLAHNAIPNADHILWPDPPGGPLTLNVNALEDYLRFLEFVVLYDRIIVVESPYMTGTSCEVVTGGMRVFRIPLVRRCPLDLQEGCNKTLEKEQILKKQTVESDDPMPEDFVTMYAATPKVRNALQKEWRIASDDDEWSGQFKNDLAFARVARSFGSAMFLSNFAKQTQAPIVFSSEQTDAIGGIEKSELSMRRAVINDLKERLDAGALDEIKRIEARGVNTIFPQTPLGWEIVRDAIVPEDLLDIALDLRKEYKQLRESMIEVDKIVLSETSTIQDKKKALREIEGLAREIWPTCRDGVHEKVLTEASSLLELAAAMGKPDGGLDVSAKLAKILSTPIGLILRALRRRRVKVLLKAKREFMYGRDFIGKIASVFNIPESIAKEAVASEQGSTLFR